MNKKRKPLELYVHIPFCIRKCAYCDFVSGPGTKAMQKEYEEALLAEIDAAEETAESEVISVFFGGGTPSAVDAGMLARVMEKLRSKYVFSEDAEITLEANPGTLDAEKLKCYRKSGFNRISIGCQSVHDEELKRLKEIVTGVANKIDGSLLIHDFRYVPGDTHTNLIFDIVVSYGCAKCDEDLKKQISEEVLKLLPNHYCVIKCDKAFT